MHVATKNLRQVDVHGGFTAAAGHSLYTARNFPKEYWNRIAFVTEPTGRLIHRTVLKQAGAGFKEDDDGWNMFNSADEWAAPIQAEVGPDGALWITDWYDFIIQHNPTPSIASSGLLAENGKGNAYINPLRDHERGRIYRLSYKNNDTKNTIALDKTDSKGLVDALSNNNMFWRTTAQRLLVEKGDRSVLPALYQLVQNETLDETGINAPAIHALWTIHGLKALDGSDKDALTIAIKALSHPAAGVRRTAIQVLPKTPATLLAMKRANVFEDKDLRVRLAAILALCDMMPSQQTGDILVSMAEREENVSDNWLRQALNIAGKINERYFSAAFRKKGLKINPSLLQASIAQRIVFGARLSAVPLRRGGRQTDASPQVSRKEMLISGNIETAPRNGTQAAGTVIPYSGLIVAQGNMHTGYGIYLLDNKLYFRINQNGKSYLVSTSKELPNKFTFKAGLQKDGTMRLFIDSLEVGAAKTPGLFQTEPTIALRVGVDTLKGNDRIMNYPDSLFRLRANLVKGLLETLELLNSASAEAGKTVIDKTIILKVVKDVMKYDKQLLTAKAGTTIQIIFQNTDFMQHNLVLIHPKTTEKVGAMADKLAADPNGTKLNYVPKMPEVIKASPLVNPGGKYILTVKLPDVPGDYPYICTFPGHWRIMKGILRVSK